MMRQILGHILRALIYFVKVVHVQIARSKYLVQKEFGSGGSHWSKPEFLLLARRHHLQGKENESRVVPDSKMATLERQI